MNRGNFRRDVFYDDEDRSAYLDLLARYSGEAKLEILGFCLMAKFRRRNFWCGFWLMVAKERSAIGRSGLPDGREAVCDVGLAGILGNLHLAVIAHVVVRFAA